MSDALVAGVVIASFVAYAVVAYATLSRARARRGRSLARAGGFAANAPYFVWVPYVVVALRPGPELPVPETLRWLGLALAVAGCTFAIWAARTLGEHFDVELEVHERHEVVRRGPYALVRHPVYSGLALHFVGACLATGNLILIAGTALVSFPAFYVRAAAEERLLRGQLGDAYDSYAREVPMLLPRP
jgi:protein-S-isoprenylcysteine O-methyltransferase Ste14